MLSQLHADLSCNGQQGVQLNQGKDWPEKHKMIADWQGIGQEREFTQRDPRREKPEDGAGEVVLWGHWEPGKECWGKVHCKET